MQIIWHGQSCFQIIVSQGKNNQARLSFASRNLSGQVSIVIDPFDETIGLKFPKLEADILLITHNHHDHNNAKAVSGSPFLIKGPGEYEVKGIYVQGVPAFHDNSQGKERGTDTIYTIETEDLKLCHLGDLGQNELTAEQLEKIGDIDILMIPVGGFSTISAKEALKIMAQIEPKITIPMHYQIPKLNPPAGGKLDSLDNFLKMTGIKKLEPISKLSIKKKDISSEEAKIIVLKP